MEYAGHRTEIGGSANIANGSGFCVCNHTCYFQIMGYRSEAIYP